VVRGLVLDSLRYWIEEMHVDGFRFDLATALARHGPGRKSDDGFDPASAFLEAVAEDPVISRVKLVAEPWDLGPEGYRLGAFPDAWAEWNDRYRDAVRRFWRGERGVAGELAARLAGSEDLFAAKGAERSVHFVTCHDGFTLRDLTSYEEKHNEANREANRDGHGLNLSRNWGVEGPTGEPDVLRARERARRNLLATVFLSRGVPMLLHGDEIGRTQHGNNNAYCQDNEISWLDWKLAPDDEAFLDFVRRLSEVRKEHPDLRPSSPRREVRWRRFDGRAIGEHEWKDVRAFAMFVPGEESDLVLLLNPDPDEVVFHLGEEGGRWTELVSTDGLGAEEEKTPPFAVPGNSLVFLLRLPS
jgi:glycogen operon protein